MISLGPVRNGANIAIGLLQNFFGIPAKVYYPRGYSYSGRLNDIKYNEEPDLEFNMLLLDPYQQKSVSEAGAHTNFEMELDAFVTHDVFIPRFSKIEAVLGYTLTKYKVEKITTHNDINGPLYQKLMLTPITQTELVESDEVIQDQHAEYLEQLKEDGVSMDNSVANSANLSVNKRLKYSTIGVMKKPDPSIPEVTHVKKEE